MANPYCQMIAAIVAETDTAGQILRDYMIDWKMYLKYVPVLVDVSVVDKWCEKLMVLWIWPEIPSGTFLGRSGKEIFWNEYMGEVEERVVPELVFGVDDFVRI